MKELAHQKEFISIQVKELGHQEDVEASRQKNSVTKMIKMVLDERIW